jgi:hypothetical protein
MSDLDRPEPRPYDVLREMHPRDLTPFERFLMRLTDWSELGAVVPLNSEPDDPKLKRLPRIPWNRPKR